MSKSTPNPEYFRVCPYCGKVTVELTKFGTGTISCNCGIKIEGNLSNWENLEKTIKAWNRRLENEIADG